MMGPGHRALPDEAAVRALLPHTWHAFFGRFGRLTTIQRLAAGPLVRGRACLLCSPTASGKTEAVVAPLLERILAAHATSSSARAAPALELLIVSPTRALANDLQRRLRGPLSRAGVSLDLKTGDSPAFDDAAPPTLLITTPESLDSMLARRPRALSDVRALVADELHLLDRSARGDQLRCLFERLDRVARGPGDTLVQRAAASATVSDPALLARRYLGLTAEVLHAGARRPRPTEATLVAADTLEAAADAIAQAWLSAEASKLLVFANVRAQVEALAARLSSHPRLRGHVFAHHGSLARGERLQVERRFLDAPSAICVATMTLELGIDIGDVDLAVLLAPPPDVGSLIQRAGRANRLGGPNRVMCLHAGPFEAARFEHLLACALDARLFDEPVAFRPTVLAQQALSLLFQNPKRHVSAAALHARLAPDAAALWSRADCAQILRQMADRGWLRGVDRDRFVAEPRAERAFEFGRIHALIADSPEVQIVDETTGRLLGTAGLRAQDRERMGQGGALALSLGGRRREVTRVSEDRVYVQSSEGLEESRFIAREAPRYSFGLARDLSAHLGLAPGELLLETGERTATLSHFLGTVFGALLAGLLTQRGHKREAKGQGCAFFVPVDLSAERLAAEGFGPAGPIAAAARAELASKTGRYARLLQPGPWLDCVPEPLVLRWVMESVSVDRFAEFLASATVRVVRCDEEQGRT